MWPSLVKSVFLVAGQLRGGEGKTPWTTKKAFLYQLKKWLTLEVQPLKKKKHLCVSSLILLEDRTNNAADNHAEILTQPVKLYEKGGF